MLTNVIEHEIELHRTQRKVAENLARFSILACGRRWGKSRLGAALCVKVALDGGRAWWVAPSYPMSQVGFRLIRRLAQQIPGTNTRLTDRIITMPGGGEVRVRSADNPDSLRGEGLDFVVLDECAFMKEDAWSEALRPSLSDRQGGAMFISTPKGRNWFWRAWQRGQDEEQGEWASYHFPTSDNPYIPDEEIEAARVGLPERIFRQEYLAEFISDAGGVYRGVMEAATATPQEQAIDGHNYVAGLDLARKVDFTVLTIMDVSLDPAELVFMDRFNTVDWNLQVGRVKAACERFRVETLIVDETGVGDPIVEQLRRELG